MEPDPELIRAILIFLSSAERSPPEPIFIGFRDLAVGLDATVERISEEFALLEDKTFIEGPGLYGEDQYLFRKLTTKGKAFIALLGDAKEWRRAKALYLPGRAPRGDD